MQKRNCGGPGSSGHNSQSANFKHRRTLRLRKEVTLMSTNSKASRSHPEDALGAHSKASQRPMPANSQPGTTSTNVHEARDVVQKRKPTPAHVGPHNQPGQERDSLNERQIKRVSRPVPADAQEVPGAAARARRAGPHGKVIHADGTSQATPSKKQVAKIG